ncbi:hypothetical protein Tco_1019609 [Tanacetum coccineum]|uniref:Uncharacterized protein n=1 Tax=Tanacetum coccineum TaxID=301880 RepID=A0ABQ5FY26_9ASTR
MRTSNYGESNASALEDLILKAGNPVKYEHVGQETRSQDGKDDKDLKDIQDLGTKDKVKDSDKGLRSKITQHEGTSLQQCYIGSYTNPSTNESEAGPVKDFIIKFNVKNGQMPLTLDYKTFCEIVGLNYNKGDYVAHPSPKVVKAELAKNITNEALNLSKVIPIKLTASMIDAINLDSSVTPLPYSEKKGKKKTPTGLPSTIDEDTRKSSPLSEAKTTDPQDTEGNKQLAVNGLPATHPDEEHQSPSPNKDDLESSNAKKSTDSPDASNSELSSCSKTFDPFDNYVPATKKHKEVAASYADLKWSIEDFLATTFKEILTNLKEVQDAVKEDHALTKKNFNFPRFKSIVESLHAIVTTQNEHLVKWVESSALMTWSVGPWMTKIENTKATIQSDIATLKPDTTDIKAMMTNMFYAYKGYLAHTATISPIRETHSQTKREKDDMITLVPTSKEVCKDPDALLLIPFEINGKLYKLTNEEIHVYMEHEERKERVAQETRLLVLSKPKLIKVVTEVTTEAKVDPKALQSSKGGDNTPNIHKLSPVNM